MGAGQPLGGGLWPSNVWSASFTRESPDESGRERLPSRSASPRGRSSEAPGGPVVESTVAQGRAESTPAQGTETPHASGFGQQQQKEQSLNFL